MERNRVGSCRTALRVGFAAVLIASAACTAYAERMIEFSGYEWTVRRTTERQGPGPNRFLDDERTVSVDDDGNLHLRIWNRGFIWYCAEVRLPHTLAYGSYIFETSSDLRFESPWVILGLFVFDHDAPELWYREIDIEFGRFGNERKPDGQFAVHPFEVPGHRYEFSLPDRPKPGDPASSPAGPHPATKSDTLTHGFRWTENGIRFRSASGSWENLFVLDTDHPAIYADWEYEGDLVFDPGNARVHLNFWLYRSRSPRLEHHVVIRSFSFVP